MPLLTERLYFCVVAVLPDTSSIQSIHLPSLYASTEKGEINHEYITGQYSPMSDFIENQYVDNTRSTYLNVSGYVELTPVKDLTFTSRVNGTLNHPTGWRREIW